MVAAKWAAFGVPTSVDTNRAIEEGLVKSLERSVQLR